MFLVINIKYMPCVFCNKTIYGFQVGNCVNTKTSIHKVGNPVSNLLMMKKNAYIELDMVREVRISSQHQILATHLQE